MLGFFGLLLVSLAPFHQDPGAISSLSVTQLYQTVLETAGTKKMPPGGPSSVVISRLAQTGQKETSTALPLMSAALENDDPVARSYAILGFLTVAARGDGTQLLAPRLGLLLKHLDDPEPAIDTLTVGVLSALKGPLPSNVIPLLRKFLSTPKARGPAGIAVVRLLLGADADSANTKRAVVSFLASADDETQGRIIELFGVMRVRDGQYIDVILAHLSTGISSFTQRTAIHALDSLGGPVYLKALPQLQHLADNSESEEVRHDARESIAKQDHQNRSTR